MTKSIIQSPVANAMGFFVLNHEDTKAQRNIMDFVSWYLCGWMFFGEIITSERLSALASLFFVSMPHDGIEGAGGDTV